MRTINLTILLIVLIPFYGYSQVYFLQKEKYILNEDRYSEELNRIEKATQFSDLPQTFEFIITGESFIFTLTEEKDFVSEKLNMKWDKTSNLEIGELVKGEIFQTNKMPNIYSSYKSEKIEVYEPGIEYVESGRNNVHTSQLIVKLNNSENQYVVFKNISLNRNKDRVKPKSIKAENVPIAGVYIKMFSNKKIREDWKKGYNIFDKWLEKVVLIRQKEHYQFVENKKQKEARQRVIRDNIRQIKLEEEARQRVIRDSIRQVELEKEKILRERRIIKKYGKTNGRLILERKVKIGFAKEMCVEAWGNPNDINTTTGIFGVHEQWVYEGYNFDNSYLYFENGILTTIQN